MACPGQVNGAGAPPAAAYASDAASVANMTVAALSSIARRGRARAASSSHRVVVPAAAVTNAAGPPRKKSALKSTTKDAGIMPRPSAVNDGLANAEMRIAAAISAENSRAWSACGHPARPSPVAAAVAIAAKIARRPCSDNRIQQPSAREQMERSTLRKMQCGDQFG